MKKLIPILILLSGCVSKLEDARTDVLNRTCETMGAYAIAVDAFTDSHEDVVQKYTDYADKTNTSRWNTWLKSHTDPETGRLVSTAKDGSIQPLLAADLLKEMELKQTADKLVADVRAVGKGQSRKMRDATVALKTVIPILQDENMKAADALKSAQQFWDKALTAIVPMATSMAVGIPLMVQ